MYHNPLKDHVKSLFCNSRYRVDGRCDKLIAKPVYFDLIREYDWVTQYLDCIQCCTFVFSSNVRYCWTWGLN